jgi:FKBP-type peptidyl-prolyl cis-trans isomerase 2
MRTSMLALAAGCSAPAVSDRKMVSMHFTGTLANGSVFETCRGNPPLEFPVGMGRMIEAGMTLTGQGPTGPIRVKVLEVRRRSVKLDFNHPLAGKDLTFEVEIMKIRDATKEELAGSTIP